MTTSILVNRIIRAVETDGAVGDGAALSAAYGEAVRKANERMEVAQAAIEANQVSEAVRLMEAPPRLMDEVSALDFHRLADWTALCGKKNWPVPPTLDKSLLERLLILNESAEAAETFLRMYRKAVRTNNKMLMLQSLRRLVEVDRAQEWKAHLAQTESQVVRQMAADFLAAKADKREEEADRIAQEFADAHWLKPPSGAGVDAIKAHLAAKAAARRDEEGREDIGILKAMKDGMWSLTLAVSILKSLDAITDAGWTIPSEERPLVAECRRRAAEEMEAVERERNWRERSEALNTAVQTHDETAIREALAAPEFLDKPPEAELAKEAAKTLAQIEKSRRRKRAAIAFCAFVCLAATLGGAFLALQRKLFEDRCQGEALRLDSLLKGDHAVERLEEALGQLCRDAPDVYADPRVAQFAGRLKSMQQTMLSRTNEIASIIGELKALKDENWRAGDDAATGRLARVHGILSHDDTAYAAEVASLEQSWREHYEADAAEKLNAATKFHDTLVSHVAIVTERLNHELSGEELRRETAACKESVAEWRRVHGARAPALAKKVEAAEVDFLAAEARQNELQEAIEKLKNAKDAIAILQTRNAIRKDFAGYEVVGALRELSATEGDAAALLEGKAPEQTTYDESLHAGISADAFAKFLSENVLSLAEIPSYYALYGVYLPDPYYPNKRKYFVVSKGRPTIRKPSYSNEWEVEGELLDMKRVEMRDKISGDSKPGCECLGPSEEIKSLVDFAGRPGLTHAKFEAELLKKIDGHLQAAEKANRTIGAFFDYRRVQLMHLYFLWLRDDLKIFPQDDRLEQWRDGLEELAQEVRVDGIPDDLTWLCVKEPRVIAREKECGKLLKKMADGKLVDVYREAKNVRKSLKSISRWSISCAGQVLFDPHDKRWTKNRGLVIPRIFDGITKDHPLYVLRRQDGKLLLRRALIPYADGTKWRIAGESANDLQPGEPFYQVAENGHFIDAEAEIARILAELPNATAKAYATRIPLFAVKERR